jgi:type II secretory pathway pseudopilin PulG
MKTIEAVVVVLIVALGASFVLNYSLYTSDQQLSSAFNNLNQSYTDLLRNEVTNSTQPHLLTNEEVAQLFPNLLTADQLWNSGACTWIDIRESQTGVITHLGYNNATVYLPAVSPCDEIMNYTEFVPDFYTGQYAGYYAHVWLQYNDSIWVEEPILKMGN